MIFVIQVKSTLQQGRSQSFTWGQIQSVVLELDSNYLSQSIAHDSAGFQLLKVPMFSKLCCPYSCEMRSNFYFCHIHLSSMLLKLSVMTRVVRLLVCCYFYTAWSMWPPWLAFAFVFVVSVCFYIYIYIYIGIRCGPSPHFF